MLIAALCLSPPGEAEPLVDTIAEIVAAQHSDAENGSQVAVRVDLSHVSRLESIDWVGGYLSAQVIPAAPVPFVFHLYRADMLPPTATPLLSLPLQATSQPATQRIADGACPTETCIWYRYRAPLPDIELAAGRYWIALAQDDERTNAHAASQWLWAQSTLTGDTATRSAANGPWEKQSTSAMQFALNGTKALITPFALPSFPVLPRLDLSKSVDNATPVPADVVEFTLQVTNYGSATVGGVQVQEYLPPALMVPEGTAPAADQGFYHLDEHLWLIGDLEPAAKATLRLPAAVTGSPVSACITNRASLSQADDPNILSEASATLSTPGKSDCVDLDVDLDSVTYSGGACDVPGTYRINITVRNHGPDSAQDVDVLVKQQPIIAPNLRFSDCPEGAATQCRLSELSSGELVPLSMTSDAFANQVTTTQIITVSVSSTGEDYQPNNNQASRQWVVPSVSCNICEDCWPDQSPVDGTSSSSIGMCFIATAAYGSWLDPHVAALREFRDQYLLPHAAGRALVEFYYRHSPAAADYIAVRPWLRATTRVVLAPVVWAVQHPLLGLLAMLTAMLGAAALCVRLATVIHRNCG